MKLLPATNFLGVNTGMPILTPYPGPGNSIRETDLNLFDVRPMVSLDRSRSGLPGYANGFE